MEKVRLYYVGPDDEHKCLIYATQNPLINNMNYIVYEENGVISLFKRNKEFKSQIKIEDPNLLKCYELEVPSSNTTDWMVPLRNWILSTYPEISKYEIDELKLNWLRDGCWDLENTPGFERYYDELAKYSYEIKKEVEELDKQNNLEFAEKLGIPNKPKLAAYLKRLEDRINKLEGLL